MVKLVKLIHPKTGTERTVPATNGNKIRILKRAGFILFKNYKPKKKKVKKPEPTVAEIAEKQGEGPSDGEVDMAAEVAVHDSNPPGERAKKKPAKKKKLRKSKVGK